MIHSYILLLPVPSVSTNIMKKCQLIIVSTFGNALVVIINLLQKEVTVVFTVHTVVLSVHLSSKIIVVEMDNSNLKNNFEKWLDKNNFNEDGSQKVSLSGLMSISF